jgi:hypothetical protein
MSDQPQSPKIKQGIIKSADLDEQEIVNVPRLSRIRVSGLRGMYGNVVKFNDNCESEQLLPEATVKMFRQQFGDQAVEEISEGK